MRIATFVQNKNLELDQRKKLLARKEMDQAYKRNARYSDETKNKVLKSIENLISSQEENEATLKGGEAGTEKSLSRDENLQLPEVKQEIKELASREREVIAHEQAHKAAGAGVTGAISYTYTTGPDERRYITGGEVSIETPQASEPEQMLKVLEKVKQAALAPAEPSPQDLLVAASAQAQILTVKGELAAENSEELLLQDEVVAPFDDEDFDVEIPAKFLKEVERNAEAETVFGKDLEKLIFQRTFMKAKQVYSNHIAMVNNSYRSYNEPLFSRTA